MEKLKQKITLKLASLLIAAALALTGGATALVRNQKAGSAFLNLAQCTSGGSDRATSTTFTLGPDESPAYGTTTMICEIGGADLIDINLFAKASSTATLLWMNQFAFDTPADLPGRTSLSQAATTTISDVDWYNEDCQTNTSNTLITHGTALCTHTMSLATSTNNRASDYVTKNITLEPLAENYVRLNFSVTGATTSLNVKVVKRNVSP